MKGDNRAQLYMCMRSSCDQNQSIYSVDEVYAAHLKSTGLRMCKCHVNCHVTSAGSMQASMYMYIHKIIFVAETVLSTVEHCLVIRQCLYSIGVCARQPELLYLCTCTTPTRDAKHARLQKTVKTLSTM